MSCQVSFSNLNLTKKIWFGMVKSSKSQLQRVWSPTNPSLLEVTQSLFLETHGKFRNIASHLNGGVICLETSNLKIFRIQGRKGVGRKKNPCATATLRKNVPGPGCRKKSPTNLRSRPRTTWSKTWPGRLLLAKRSPILRNKQRYFACNCSWQV